VVIEIDEQQREVLRSLVETRLSYLSSEIRHTYSPPMRQDLRGEREALRSLAAVLAPRRAEV
jgi:hypothetical protein